MGQVRRRQHSPPPGGETKVMAADLRTRAAAFEVPKPEQGVRPFGQGRQSSYVLGRMWLLVRKPVRRR